MRTGPIRSQSHRYPLRGPRERTTSGAETITLLFFRYQLTLREERARIVGALALSDGIPSEDRPITTMTFLWSKTRRSEEDDLELNSPTCSSGLSFQRIQHREHGTSVEHNPRVGLWPDQSNEWQLPSNSVFYEAGILKVFGPVRIIRALLPFLRASQHLSLNKQLITIDHYIVYVAVDKERGLMNSRCSNLSRPEGNQWCHSLLQLQGTSYAITLRFSVSLLLLLHITCVSISLDLYKSGADYRRPPIYLEYKIIAVSVWPHLLQQRAPVVF